MSSEKKPGFWQRLFGLGPEEPPKKEPPAPKPAKKEPDSKPAQKEPPERKKPPKRAEGAQAKKSAKLKAPPPAGPLVPKDEEGPEDDGPKGPKPGGGKRPRKPKSEAPAAPPPAGPAAREGAKPPEERAPGTREKGTPDEPDLPSPATEPEKSNDDKPSQASAESALAPRRSWFTQLRSGLARTSSALSDNLTSVLSRRKLDAETLDELEDALIKADLGVAMAARIRVKETRSPDRGLRRQARAYVQIQNGCDHRCTFCIIPYGRGPSRSVPAGEVVAQVRKLVENGYAEIVLTGVDITAYGADLPGEITLGKLVSKILALVPELKRLRLSSIDSIEADAALLKAIARRSG